MGVCNIKFYMLVIYNSGTKGPVKCCVTVNFWTFDTQPPPLCNANKVVLYIVHLRNAELC